MYINITDKKEAQNKGSSAKLVHYLEKENRTENRQQPEMWFNGQVVNNPSNGGERATSDIIYITKGA